MGADVDRLAGRAALRQVFFDAIFYSGRRLSLGRWNPSPARVFSSLKRGIYMAAKILCLSASLLGATLGACWPIADKNESNNAQNATSSAEGTNGSSGNSAVADIALEIALNQFPGGYQSRWAKSTAACADDPETSTEIMSLQGRLIKLPEDIGTMVQGKRMTSKTMEAEFEFVGSDSKSTRSMGFELSEDRQRLTRTDLSDGLRTRYVRCPKLMAG